MFMPRKRTQTSCVGIYVSFCKKQYTLYKSCGLSCLGNLISSLCDLLLANLWTMRNNGKTVLILYFVNKILRTIYVYKYIVLSTKCLGRQPQKFQLMKTTINHSHFRIQFVFDIKILHCLDSSLSHIERKRAINCVDIKLKSARCFLGTICAFSVNTLDTTLHAYWQRTQRN